jgi:hypothetical protein
MHKKPLTGTVAITLGLALASPAYAYTYESIIGSGCHERIAMQSLRAVRTRLPTAPLVAPDQNDNALITDVPYTLDDDMKDLTGASITIGVRDNDLKGRGPMQLDQLMGVHGDPADQREHCLRDIEDDEPDGSQPALERCKAFIREKVASALDGLDADGYPDPARRIDVVVTLDIRGQVTASLPRFWIEIGRAMHTLEDSFTHSFRSPDRLKVGTVLNWVEYVGGNEVESRDGPVHRNELDQCDGLDDLRALNLGVATQASTEFLQTVLDPALTVDAKVAAVDALLEKYIGYQPGCTFDNGWCDAPERQYQVGPSCGCSATGATPGGAFAGLSFAFGATWFARRRRRRVRAAIAALGLLALLSTGRAQAEANPVPPAGAPSATSADAKKPEEKAPAGKTTTTERKEEIIEAHHRASTFGLYAAGSGSVNDPGLSGQVGLRLRLSDRWTVGLDGELNGWLAVQTKTFRAGAFNAYGTIIFRTPLRFEALNLRTTATLGTSVLLIDLYGAPRGNVGIFAGLVPLGIEWKASSSLYVIFDPLGIALPVPQLRGVPFLYTQYRAALGLELAL